MKLKTTSIFALAFQATLLIGGAALAKESAATDVVSEATPKPPIKSEGCGLSEPKISAKPGGPSKRMKLGDRYLRVSLPKNYELNVPAPLIVAYHDFNISASEFEKLTMLSNQAYNKDAIVVYPEASHDVSSFPNLMSRSEKAAGLPIVILTTSLLIGPMDV
jgi:hypothetical protein